MKAGSSAFLTATQGIAINCLLGVDQYTECYQETDSQYGDFWSELGWDGFFCTSQLCHVVRHLDKKKINRSLYDTILLILPDSYEYLLKSLDTFGTD